MDTEIRKIVLVPRFTTYASARTFYTAPLNVRDFAYAHVTVWRGTGIGTALSFSLQLQASPDLQIWTSLGSAFTSGGEETQVISIGHDWMRVAITVGGTDPAFTCWAVGDFATRTPAEIGG